MADLPEEQVKEPRKVLMQMSKLLDQAIALLRAPRGDRDMGGGGGGGS